MVATDSISNVQPMLNQYKQHINWDEYITLINDLSYNISKDRYLNLAGIPRGGILVAILLSHKLNLPYIDISKATKDTLIIDDISDSGQTILDTIKKYNLESDFAVLHLRYNSKYKPKYFASIILNNDWIIYPYEEE